MTQQALTDALTALELAMEAARDAIHALTMTQIDQETVSVCYKLEAFALVAKRSVERELRGGTDGSTNQREGVRGTARRKAAKAKRAD